jgi:hypothetical protein
MWANLSKVYKLIISVQYKDLTSLGSFHLIQGLGR